MGCDVKTITIDGVEYVRADQVTKTVTDDYVIVRTYSAGVFAGNLKSRDGKEVTLTGARRFWSWQGAASLSQMAMSGTSKPDGCKFPEPVTEVVLTEVIEVLRCTEKARKSIEGVRIWKA